MTIRKIIQLPDERLRRVCERIEDIDNVLQSLIDDMFETLYGASGVGLAAPQIGICKRLAVIDVTKDQSQQLVLINPVLLQTKDNKKIEEGCLSLVGAGYETVKRAACVTMQALDRTGEAYELEAEGLLAQCIQHEIEHLDGKLFIDHLSPLKRYRARQKLKKHQRQVAKKAT